MKIDLPIVHLSFKQKLILETMIDEFHGTVFGPQLLDESNEKNIQNLSINEITYAMGVLVSSALVTKTKKRYKNRILNEYSISDYIKNDVIIIK